jgi:hypothetical protein
MTFQGPPLETTSTPQSQTPRILATQDERTWMPHFKSLGPIQIPVSPTEHRILSFTLAKPLYAADKICSNPAAARWMLETYGTQRYHLSQTDQWKNELRVWTSTWEPREETDPPSKDPRHTSAPQDQSGFLVVYGTLLSPTFPNYTPREK